ncbi:MAG: galactokinase [Clostridiales bacterium]|nr:galactokinase [Clostridiales bacterium]
MPLSQNDIILSDVAVSLYGKSEYAQRRLGAAYTKFVSLFGVAPVTAVSASGRAEICGNHTDHNNGCVIAAAVNRDMVALAHPRDDMGVRIVSQGYSGMIDMSLGSLEVCEGERHTTTALMRGICNYLNSNGRRVGGADIYIISDVAKGSGLSSSAAVEVLLGEVMNSLYNECNIPPLELALAGKYSENKYFGKPSGLMDQTASALGGILYIDFENEAAPVVKKLELDLETMGYAMVVVNTGGNHADLTGAYASIPEEMKRVAGLLGGKTLRAVSEDKFYSSVAMIRKKLGDRAVMRAMHFFDENERVRKAFDAVESKDMGKFLECINSSGESSWRLLQNCYVPTSLSQPLAFAQAITARLLKGTQYAVRLHGGGFEGTVEAFVPLDALEGYTRRMKEIFGNDNVLVLSFRQAGAIKIA